MEDVLDIPFDDPELSRPARSIESAATADVGIPGEVGDVVLLSSVPRVGDGEQMEFVGDELLEVEFVLVGEAINGDFDVVGDCSC